MTATPPVPPTRAGLAPAPAPESSAASRRRGPSSRIVALILVAILSLLWGIGWKRLGALVEIASFLPIAMLLIGPGVMVVWLASRLLVGELRLRSVGPVVATAVIAATVGNMLTPALPPSADVPGHVSGTLDGAAIDEGATCRWGPGQTAVVAVSWPSAASTNLPAGTVVLLLPSGATSLEDIHGDSLPATMPLRNGTGGVGEGDRLQGTITLSPAEGALVPGELRWACEAAPAP